MKPFGSALFALLLPIAVHAQAIRSDQLPPLQQQWQQEGSPPVPGASAGQGTDPTTQDQQPSPPVAATPPVPMERPNNWLPGSVVKVQALDKVNAQSAMLTIKVGDSTSFGSLKITAKACVVRPTDQPSDSAAYLAVTDSHPDSAGFTGWILQAEPSVSMMENPIYDLRVTGCT